MKATSHREAAGGGETATQQQRKACGHQLRWSCEGAVDDRDEDDEQAEEDVRQVVDLRRNLRGDGRHGRR